jgi:hypothetical protein
MIKNYKKIAMAVLAMSSYSTHAVFNAQHYKEPTGPVMRNKKYSSKANKEDFKEFLKEVPHPTYVKNISRNVLDALLSRKDFEFNINGKSYFIDGSFNYKVKSTHENNIAIVGHILHILDDKTIRDRFVSKFKSKDGTLNDEENYIFQIADHMAVKGIIDLQSAIEDLWKSINSNVANENSLKTDGSEIKAPVEDSFVKISELPASKNTASNFGWIWANFRSTPSNFTWRESTFKIESESEKAFKKSSIDFTNSMKNSSEILQSQRENIEKTFNLLENESERFIDSHLYGLKDTLVSLKYCTEVNKVEIFDKIDELNNKIKYFTEIVNQIDDVFSKFKINKKIKINWEAIINFEANHREVMKNLEPIQSLEQPEESKKD